MAKKPKDEEVKNDVGSEMNESDVQEDKKSIPEGIVSKVVFTLKNHNSPTGHSARIFDEENHGENFLELADSFEEANKSVILKRENE